MNILNEYYLVISMIVAAAANMLFKICFDGSERRILGDLMISVHDKVPHTLT